MAFLLFTLRTDISAQELSGAAARICSATDAGGYAAFPDVCRTKSGDLLCVFYSGSGHVTTSSAEWPKCGRIMAIRSADEGNTWSKPEVIMDTSGDDRDSSLTCLKDGTLLMNWFERIPGLKPDSWSGIRVLLSRSTDSGHTWGEPEPIEFDSKYSFACSAPVRQLPDGTLLFGLYHEYRGDAFGATIKSYDQGKTWEDLALIGEKSGLYLDAETDVVALKDGRLLAALRSSKDMYCAESINQGKTWGPVKSIGFQAHCPYFLLHSSGAILLATRHRPNEGGNQTALHWSTDEGKTWNGPLLIDGVGGAYPSMVELSDGEVYCVYYEEGEGSSIRGKRLRVTPGGVDVVPPAKR